MPELYWLKLAPIPVPPNFNVLALACPSGDNRMGTDLFTISIKINLSPFVKNQLGLEAALMELVPFTEQQGHEIVG